MVPALFLSLLFVASAAGGSGATSPSASPEEPAPPPPPSGDESGESVLPRASGCAAVDEHLWILFVKPKQPRAKTIPAIATALGAPLTCYRSGLVRAHVATAKLRALFGHHVTLRCQPNAGNAIGADGYLGEVVPPKLVPESLKSVAAKLWIENDPKFEIVDRAPQVPCPSTP